MDAYTLSPRNATSACAGCSVCIRHIRWCLPCQGKPCSSCRKRSTNMWFRSFSNPNIRNTLRLNGDRRSVRSFKKLSTSSGRQRLSSTTNMDQSCSLVSSLACLQPKASTQTRSPPRLPRACNYDVPAHGQKQPQARGKIRTGRPPPRPYIPMELVPNSYRR